MSETESGLHIPDNDARAGRPGTRRFVVGLSIRQRLPLLIAALLCAVVVACTWAAYDGVKQSALGVGRERLLNLTEQLASLSQQSSVTMMNKTAVAANDSAVRAYLQSPSPALRQKAAEVLKQFASAQDQNNLQVELWAAANNSLALAVPDNASPQPSDLTPEFRQSTTEPFKSLGVMRLVNDTIAYPAVVAVKDETGKPIGYLVRWRKVASTPEARKQLTDLLGSQSALYLGNSSGNLWTDLEQRAPGPPADLKALHEVTHYSRNGNSVMALGRQINGTPWFVVVEFPDQIFLGQARRFLKRMVIIGAGLTLIGVFGAFVLSRNITRPLRSLTEAAAAISGGDYSRSVDLKRNDELGALACAFNKMAGRVSESQQELEHRIKQRTEDLEAANKELESFSYSVSHDLRAPLRAINGFSRILSEEYGGRIPPEARRHLGLIQENAKNMGQLVDDLLNFSRLGRQSLQRQKVAPADLARQVLDELQTEQEGRSVRISIGDLPAVQADPLLLKQVYVNLLSNALKYTRGRDEAQIEIGVVKANGNGGEDIFFVRDNGAGFDMQYAGKLFGVFQRLHRSEEFEGTGVGLAIVHRIIQRHGGRVWAEATINQGARFCFTLREETPA